MKTKNFAVLLFVLSACFVLATDALSQSKSEIKSSKKSNESSSYDETCFDLKNKRMNCDDSRDQVYEGKFLAEFLSNKKEGLKLKLIPVNQLPLQDIDGKPISIQNYRAKLKTNKYRIEPILQKEMVIGWKLRRHSLIDTPTPAFSVETIDKKTVNSENLRGQVIVVNFWYIGCPPCRKEIPALNEVADSYKGESVTFLAISISDSVSDLLNFREKTKMNFQIVADGTLYAKFKTEGFPHTFVIDKKGNIIFSDSYLGKNGKRLKNVIETAIKKE